MTMGGTHLSKSKWQLLLYLPFLAGVYFRFHNLDRQSLFLDETFSAGEVNG